MLLAFGGTAVRNTDYTMACPTPLPTGVTCTNLNSGDNQSHFHRPRFGQHRYHYHPRSHRRDGQ